MSKVQMILKVVLSSGDEQEKITQLFEAAKLFQTYSAR